MDFTPQASGDIPAHILVVVTEGTGRLTAISPDGTEKDLGLYFGTPEMLSFVPLNLSDSGNPLEGFYAADYPVNVIKAGANEFLAYKGDAVIIDESNPMKVITICTIYFGIVRSGHLAPVLSVPSRISRKMEFS